MCVEGCDNHKSSASNGDNGRCGCHRGQNIGRCGRRCGCSTTIDAATRRPPRQGPWPPLTPLRPGARLRRRHRGKNRSRRRHGCDQYRDYRGCGCDLNHGYCGRHRWQDLGRHGRRGLRRGQDRGWHRHLRGRARAAAEVTVGRTSVNTADAATAGTTAAADTITGRTLAAADAATARRGAAVAAALTGITAAANATIGRTWSAGRRRQNLGRRDRHRMNHKRSVRHCR